MVKPPVGAGSQYVIGLRDSEGGILNGSETYKLHIPANVPAKRFWEITVYDNQTRCMLQTDQRLPGVTSIQSDVVQNADGSYDVSSALKSRKARSIGYKPSRIKGGTYSGESTAQPRSGTTRHGVRVKLRR